MNITIPLRYGHIKLYQYNFTFEMNPLVLQVTVVGTPDTVTGMVMNISDLKKIIKTQVMDQLDHKNIDKQVDWFRDKVSTTENVAVFCWDQIQDQIPTPAKLYSIKIWETEKNIVTYYGL